MLHFASLRRGLPLALATAALAAATNAEAAPVVTTDNGSARGATVTGGFAFRGLPYAAAPTGNLRWRAPRPVRDWDGIRDATRFAPSAPQPVGLFTPKGAQSEDSLYLNVATPTLRRNANRPVIVWFHGGGFVVDSSSNYDAAKFASDGTVVVTVNYRLGALGQLAHPALVDKQGATGNYGLMDQQAALRWVQRNIADFGGDPHNVTIAGESAGGLAVLMHLVSPGSHGLFQRAIVQSGSFALQQQSLADAKAAGVAFAAQLGNANASAEWLRKLPVETLVKNYPSAAIPGVIDGKVLTESIGTALASGHFARVPVLNGVNHLENLIFATAPVVGGRFVPLTEPVTPESYQRVIAATLNVPAERAAQIAAEYPLSAYPSPDAAFVTLVSDAGFAAPALQVDRWLSKHVPTFAYQFDDDSAPQRYTPPGLLPQVATHISEIQYLFDQPNTPFAVPFNQDQRTLSATMRAAWASFAATGDPSTKALPWPAYRGTNGAVISLRTPQPIVERNSTSTHHSALWTTR